MNKRVILTFLVLTMLLGTVVPAYGDTATFIQREQNNLEGWYNFFTANYDSSSFRDYQWGDAASALAFAVLYKKTGNISYAFKAKSLLDGVYANSLNLYPPQPDGSCDYWQSVNVTWDGKAATLYDWVVAYALTKPVVGQQYGWDSRLIDLADAWQDTPVRPGMDWNRPCPPPFGYPWDSGAETNAAIAQFLGAMWILYPDTSGWPYDNSGQGHKWYLNGRRFAAHTSTICTTDYPNEPCVGQTLTFGSWTERSAQLLVTPDYKYKMSKHNKSDNPHYGLTSLAMRGQADVLSRRMTGYWLSTEFANKTSPWFLKEWEATGFPDTNLWDTGYYECGDSPPNGPFESWEIKHPRREGDGAAPTSWDIFAAAYYETRYSWAGTWRTDSTLGYLPPSASDYVAPLSEVVHKADFCPDDAANDPQYNMPPSFQIREHPFFTSPNYGPHPSYLFDAVVMARHAYALFNKDTSIVPSFLE